MFETLRSQTFFHDKNRAFWILQGGGWLAYLLLRVLSGLANSMGVSFILPAVIVTATGFSLTLLMAAAYRRIIVMRPVLRLDADAAHPRCCLGGVLGA